MSPGINSTTKAAIRAMHIPPNNYFHFTMGIWKVKNTKQFQSIEKPNCIIFMK